MPQSAPAYLRLPCKLTDAEKATKSDALARELKTYAEIETRKKSATRVLGDELKESRKRADELAEAVRTGRELREVPVQHRKILGERNVMETWRLDTGEVVDTRALEPHERQVEMFAREDAKLQTELESLYSKGPKDDEDEDDELDAATEH